MKEYDVKITETLEKTVTVQAESHDAAEEQVRAAYYNSEYILDSENFTGVAFGTTEEREVQKEQADTMNVLLVRLTGTTRSIVKSGGMNGKSSRTAIWKPMTARSVWTCVPMPDRGLILSLLSMRGLLSGRWKSVVSRRISAT